LLQNQSDSRYKAAAEIQNATTNTCSPTKLGNHVDTQGACEPFPPQVSRIPASNSKASYNKASYNKASYNKASYNKASYNKAGTVSSCP